MSTISRVIWHLAFYLVALLGYYMLSNGQGRFELLTKIMVAVWPLVAIIDVLSAKWKPK